MAVITTEKYLSKSLPVKRSGCSFPNGIITKSCHELMTDASILLKCAKQYVISIGQIPSDPERRIDLP